MGALSLSFPLILRCILRRPPPSAVTHISPINPSFFKTKSLAVPLLPISRNSLSKLIPRSLTLSAAVQTDTPSAEDAQSDVESEIDVNDSRPAETETENPIDARISSAHKEMLAKLKGMSVKEKKELGSYANSLGKKLKSQQVGKSGVTDSVAMALVETLEANELLKLKIHNSCPGELEDVVSQLEKATGSVVVGQIGRTVIIYRPSLTKLKAEEKKKQAMKVFLKRRSAFKSSNQGRMQSRGQSRTPSNQSRNFRKS